MRRKLPLKSSPEGKRIIERYLSGERDLLAEELGFANYSSLQTAMAKHYRIRLSELNIETNELSDLEQQILNNLKSGPLSVGELSRRLDRSKETVIRLIDSLKEKHYHVSLDETRREVEIPKEPVGRFEPTEYQYFRKHCKIGCFADTHIGSKYQQMSLLYDAYSIVDDEKTDFNIHAGDLMDGRNMYRGQEQETFLRNAEEQREYTIKNYPESRRGVKTYIIGGQHDRSYYKESGYNIVEHIYERRDDLVYKGFYDAQFDIKNVSVGVHHPGGGASYARSYRVQRIIENMMGYYIESNKSYSKIQLFGHWHFSVHLPSYMGITAITLPCFQSQTPYLAQRGLMPDVGFVILDLWFDDAGNLTKIVPEFYNLSSRVKEMDY